MTATADPPSSTAPLITAGEPAAPVPPVFLDRAEGIELLGPVHGSGYKEGAALVRRPDGQIVQLGPLMYGLLECLDGRRGVTDLATAMSERLGRQVQDPHIVRLSEKLAQQGLIAGTEGNAPPRRNPLLAMHWKVLVTNPKVTRRLSAPFAFLFHPWLMWPIWAAFVAVSWFVLVDKGVASATFQAFHSPGLLILVFALAIVSAGFHELGHAAACRYSGVTPGGMGMGIYLVWPAFYTDVTDAYRLPKRARLRIDLAGLYFNAVVAVLTMVVWLFWRVDALLLLVALQILQMVKQLSPIIRADGYHILSDATGIPDLYAHVGPTLRRLLPGHRRQPTALTGKARLLVTVWVLVVVPVLLSLMLGAVLLLPHLATTAWESGRRIAVLMPHQASNFQMVKLGASALKLLALLLPVAASALVAQKVVRSAVAKALSWSAGRPGRRLLVAVLGAGLMALLAWAWWPSGQYKPIRPNQGGTIPQLLHLDASPAASGHPVPSVGPAGATLQHPTVALTPGSHLAVAMVPVGGATSDRPAVYFLPGSSGQKPTELVSFGGNTEPRVFPFALPAAPGPGDTQALAVNTKDGSVLYDVAYAVVTVSGGEPVTNTNSAYAIAQCTHCTTAAVSFQVVLVVGQSNEIAPINGAGALNYRCLSCMTTAIADQIIVTLQSQPPQALLSQLEAALARLDLLPKLGANGTPAALAAAVGAVEQQVLQVLGQSGLLAGQPTTATSVAGASTPASTGTTVPATTSGDTTATTVNSASSSSSVSTTAPTSSTTTATTSSSSDTSTSTSPTTDTAVTTTPTTAP